MISPAGIEMGTLTRSQAAEQFAKNSSPAQNTRSGARNGPSSVNRVQNQGQNQVQPQRLEGLFNAAAVEDNAPPPLNNNQEGFFTGRVALGLAVGVAGVVVSAAAAFMGAFQQEDGGVLDPNAVADHL